MERDCFRACNFHVQLVQGEEQGPSAQIWSTTLYPNLSIGADAGAAVYREWHTADFVPLSVPRSYQLAHYLS